MAFPIWKVTLQRLVTEVNSRTDMWFIPSNFLKDSWQGNFTLEKKTKGVCYSSNDPWDHEIPCSTWPEPPSSCTCFCFIIQGGGRRCFSLEKMMGLRKGLRQPLPCPSFLTPQPAPHAELGQVFHRKHKREQWKFLVPTPDARLSDDIVPVYWSIYSVGHWPSTQEGIQLASLREHLDFLRLFTSLGEWTVLREREQLGIPRCSCRYAH